MGIRKWNAVHDMLLHLSSQQYAPPRPFIPLVPSGNAYEVPVGRNLRDMIMICFFGFLKVNVSDVLDFLRHEFSAQGAVMRAEEFAFLVWHVIWRILEVDVNSFEGIESPTFLVMFGD